MSNGKEPVEKGGTVILAVLVIISALGIYTYYDSQGNVIECKDCIIITDNLTKIIDERITENTTTKVAYVGATTIKDALTLSSGKTPDKMLSEETVKVLKDVKYPYDISVPVSKTEFKITNYTCDSRKSGLQGDMCGYWIQATRDGQEVQTNSPIWIFPPPYLFVVSDVYYTALDERTITTDKDLAAIEVITLKEDPKAAVEKVLQDYVSRQPLGKSTVGTKE